MVLSISMSTRNFKHEQTTNIYTRVKSIDLFYISFEQKKHELDLFLHACFSIVGLFFKPEILLRSRLWYFMPFCSRSTLKIIWYIIGFHQIWTIRVQKPSTVWNAVTAMHVMFVDIEIQGMFITYFYFAFKRCAKQTIFYRTFIRA